LMISSITPRRSILRENFAASVSVRAIVIDLHYLANPPLIE
jgi:hypothetical protein